MARLDRDGFEEGERQQQQQQRQQQLIGSAATSAEYGEAPSFLGGRSDLYARNPRNVANRGRGGGRGGGGRGGGKRGGSSAARARSGGGGVPPNDSAIFGSAFVRRITGLFESRLRAAEDAEQQLLPLQQAMPAGGVMSEVERRLFAQQNCGVSPPAFGTSGAPRRHRGQWRDLAKQGWEGVVGFGGREGLPRGGQREGRPAGAVRDDRNL